MENVASIETGLQLLSRLSKRPTIEGLDSVLFKNGPCPRETIEITGDLSTGKTRLVTQLIAKCILPSFYSGIKIGGLGIGVLLVNKMHHFRVSKLAENMHYIVEQACKAQNILYANTLVQQLVIIPSLEKLTVINCYDSYQLRCTINTLDDTLVKNPNIGLIVVDSLSTIYWQNREIGGNWLIDQYIKNFLRHIQKYIFQYNIVLMYTRNSYFASKIDNPVELAAEPVFEKINYKIDLGCQNSQGIIQTFADKNNFFYKIEPYGMKWLLQDT